MPSHAFATLPKCRPIPPPSPTAKSLIGNSNVPFLATYVVLAVLGYSILGSQSVWVLLLPPSALLIPAVLYHPRWHFATASLLFAEYFVLLLLNLTEAPWGVRIAGTVVLLVALSPFALRPLSRTDEFPFLHIFCLGMACYITVVVLFSDTVAIFEQPVAALPRPRTMGFLWLAVFIACVILGYVVLMSIRFNYRRGPTRPQGIQRLDTARSHATVLAVAILSTIGIAALASLTSGESLGQVLVALSLIPTAAVLLLWHQFLRGRLPPQYLFALIALSLLSTLHQIGPGLFQGAEIPLGALAVYVHVRRRVPWILVAMGLLLTLGFNVGKLEVRENPPPESHSLVPDQFARGQRMAAIGFSPSTYTAPSLASSTSRFASQTSDLLGYYIEVIPSRFSHSGIDTYAAIPWFFVPRDLYPAKPRFTFGQELGHRFATINDYDMVTAANVPVHAEAYAAFGYAGLAVVALLFGLLLGTLARVFRGPTLATSVTGALFVITLIYAVDADHTLAIGGLPLLALVAAPLVRILCKAAMLGTSPLDTQRQALDRSKLA